VIVDRQAATGLFVTIDGAGGTGKTTVTSLLKESLDLAGQAVHATAEPSSGELGVIARTKSDIYRGLTLACLVAADRYHHLEHEILPLRAHRIVICDRYIPSSYVLQRIDGVDLDFVRALNAAAAVPDLSIVLTAAPEEIAGRIRRRGWRTRFEAAGSEGSELELALFAQAAISLAEMGWDVLLLDTTGVSATDVAAVIHQRILSRLTGGT
jgi:dTMP kinase